MNNMLKELFVGKTMTQRQIVKWERARSKGKAMYVARVTLSYGTINVVMLSLGFHYLIGALLDARIILLNALIVYPVGFLLGLGNWSAMEKKYHERLNVK
ncbi:MAG TPA: hypothetical protein VI260_06635 [Blastocatellia bacterium]|jgi:hypothetical protein